MENEERDEYKLCQRVLSESNDSRPSQLGLGQRRRRHGRMPVGVCASNPSTHILHLHCCHRPGREACRMKRSGRDSSHHTPSPAAVAAASRGHASFLQAVRDPPTQPAANNEQTKNIKTYLGVGRADSGHKENSVGNLHDDERY